MKRRSMDYDGPVRLATLLYGDKASKDNISFQSPSDLDTRREDAGRPSKKVSYSTTKAE
jgi:hypothetical protein